MLSSFCCVCLALSHARFISSPMSSGTPGRYDGVSRSTKQAATMSLFCFSRPQKRHTTPNPFNVVRPNRPYTTTQIGRQYPTTPTMFIVLCTALRTCRKPQHRHRTPRCLQHIRLKILPPTTFLKVRRKGTRRAVYVKKHQRRRLVQLILLLTFFIQIRAPCSTLGASAAAKAGARWPDAILRPFC